ncbi:O-acetyl-ADP-ribose deacetylase [Leptospira adleri]|uniref:O-acetyl-ADP-ribose deacetylase n=1 Tax=Leptospira adleri TaxID=2023186 RepID=A0A2M9YSI1_9LEPT|nr:O-acetyl-ADP-ribose deacetylase [Leptospira adleri]PJZ54469.1 O-acetyl-ADP-ribose deacetylase [Leptospira adleri]PJZ61321.1 O-acetyl-ADP-ribose deacetylase [Leptospira adleri]
MKDRIQLIHGDITKLKVDAIVNAANNSLLGGGGVDGAIHNAGGPEILEECYKIRNKQGNCKTGEAVITKAGKLQAKFVIHTVGPIWYGGKKNEDELLKNAYTNSLLLAKEYSILTIAFPNISTGIYNFPKERAAKIAVHSVLDFLKNDGKFEKIFFVCFDSENFKIYEGLL